MHLSLNQPTPVLLFASWPVPSREAVALTPFSWYLLCAKVHKGLLQLHKGRLLWLSFALYKSVFYSSKLEMAFLTLSVESAKRASAMGGKKHNLREVSEVNSLEAVVLVNALCRKDALVFGLCIDRLQHGSEHSFERKCFCGFTTLSQMGWMFVLAVLPFSQSTSFTYLYGHLALLK